jgi:hypothetical protein
VCLCHWMWVQGGVPCPGEGVWLCSESGGQGGLEREGGCWQWGVCWCSEVPEGVLPASLELRGPWGCCRAVTLSCSVSAAASGVFLHVLCLLHWWTHCCPLPGRVHLPVSLGLGSSGDARWVGGIC